MGDGTSAEGGSIPFIDTSELKVIERLPGWHGRFFHSPSMTFWHYGFTRGSSIHEHFHPQEEVWEVIDGELEVTIDGVTRIARAGLVRDRAGKHPAFSQGPHRRSGHHRRLPAAA